MFWLILILVVLAAFGTASLVVIARMLWEIELHIEAERTLRKRS